MSLRFVVLLIVAAFAALVYMLRKIRKSELDTADSVFWFMFSFSLFLLAVCPPIADFFARVFGIQSSQNFVFLYVIAILLIKQFLTTVEVSKLRNKVATLAQEDALYRLRASAEDGEERRDNRDEAENE